MPELENSAETRTGASRRYAGTLRVLCRFAARALLVLMLLRSRFAACCAGEVDSYVQRNGHRTSRQRGLVSMVLKLALDNGAGSIAPRLSDCDELPPADRVVATPSKTLDTIYRAQAPRLLRFFARRSSVGDAEDMVSESFARLMPALARGGVDNPEGYLQEVAKNVLRNRARAAFYRSIEEPTADIDILAVASDPITMIEARETLARLQAALDTLPAKTRAIFVAHRLHGATYADIAGQQGLSVKGVEWHMSKAIAHLARAMGRR